MLGETVFSIIVEVTGALATAAAALFYFRHVRLQRPPIGVFNARDLCFLLILIVVLPLLYLVLPGEVLTAFLVLTFLSALYIALRPFLSVPKLVPLIVAVLAANIVVTSTLLGTQTGWQVYWGLIDVVTLLAAVGVSNLYIQSGLRLRHVAWFAFVLGFYDGFFAFGVPILGRLADAFEGRPLDPSIGFVLGPYNANVGLGDLLIFSLFMVAAYKGFGRRGAIASFIIIGIFGALIPASVPYFFALFVRQGIGIIVPIQMFFGPASLVTYFLLSRHAHERSMAEYRAWEASTDQSVLVVSRRQPARQSVAEQKVVS